MKLDYNNDHSSVLEALTWHNAERDSGNHEAVIKILNIILADETVLQMKTCHALYDMHGAGFDERHILFNHQHQQLVGIFDNISNHTLTLGSLPVESFLDCLRNTRIDEQSGSIPEMMDLLADHETMIHSLRKDAKKCSEDYADETNAEFPSGIQWLHEKMSWMLHSYIEPELNGDEWQGIRFTQFQSDMV